MNCALFYIMKVDSRPSSLFRSLYLLLPGFFLSVNNHGECLLTQYGATVVAVVSEDRLWSEKRMCLMDSLSLYFGNLANAVCLPNNGCNYLLLSGWRCANYSAIDLLSVCFPDNGCNYLLLSGIRCVNYSTIDLPHVCIFVWLICESMSTNADRGLEDTGGHVPITRIRARHAISR